jgi:phosphocarrier protein HPr
MTVKEAVVKSQNGLYARPATFFVQKANEHTCSIWVEKEERRANAKSLLGVLSMGVTQGTKIQLIADGPGEGEAVEELAALLAGDQAE